VFLTLASKVSKKLPSIRQESAGFQGLQHPCATTADRL